MKVVFKYNQDIKDILIFDLPYNSQILRIDSQDDRTIALWALVDPNIAITEMRKIRIAGTGHPITEGTLHYINTFTMMNKKLWFHAFEVI